LARILEEEEERVEVEETVESEEVTETEEAAEKEAEVAEEKIEVEEGVVEEEKGLAEERAVEVEEEEVCQVMFPKGKDVKYLFTALANLLHEANIIFTPDGIRMKSIDPSKVSLLILDIPSMNLEEIRVLHPIGRI